MKHGLNFVFALKTHPRACSGTGLVLAVHIPARYMTIRAILDTKSNVQLLILI